MISQTSEELVATAPVSVAKATDQSLKPQKLNGKTFDFLWWRDSRRENASKKEEKKKNEDSVEIKVIESKTRNNTPSNKTSFVFFKNIKKHVQIKKLTRRSRRKTKEVETPNLQNDACAWNCSPTISVEENNTFELKCEDTAKCSDILNSNKALTATEVSQNNQTSEDETIESGSATEKKLEVINETDTTLENVMDVAQSSSNNKIQQLESKTIEDDKAEQVENVVRSTKANTSTDNKVKVSLTEELLKLSNYGWYWGPISGNEADAKLQSEPDGAFLVRDSSDDRYVLTLSFKSSGKLLHARMEHTGGLFSLCNQSENEGFSSVADLIDYSMNFSQSAVFCYSRPKYPGQPSFPVRLTKPVSRFTQVRSLQYLCRFVIRQNTRLDNIHKLPLPKTIKGYIEEAHY